MNRFQSSAVLICATAFLLVGCPEVRQTDNLGGQIQSISDAGITSLSRVPVVIPQGSTTADSTHIVFGKEYGTFTAKVDLACTDGEPLSIEVQASEVAAFKGQQIGAQAAESIQEYLTVQNIALSKDQAETIQAIVSQIFSSAMPVTP